jgi:hypothetical protein
MQHLFRLGVDIDFSDDEGFMALHHAVLSGFEDCVKELINWGSDVNAMTRHGVPLNLAAQKERGHVISILVGARADKARAVDFAVKARGQSVKGLCSLLDLTVTGTTAKPVPALSDDGEDVVGEDRPAVPTAAEIGAQTYDETNQLQHATTKHTATQNDKSHLPDLQDGRSTLHDEFHSTGGRETLADNEVDDANRESVSEDLSEDTYTSHLSEKPARHTRKASSKSHKTLWRERGVTDVEDLSVLTPRQWRLPDHGYKDHNTLRAYRGAHAISGQETTGDLVPHELPQQSPSLVILESLRPSKQRLDLKYCQMLDPALDEKDYDLYIRNRRKINRSVRDWIWQQPPVMLHFLPQTDRSTNQEPKVQVSISAHSDMESDHGSTEIPTKKDFVALASKYFQRQRETTTASDEQHVLSPIRRRAPEQQSTSNATEKPTRQSEKTKSSSIGHGGNKSSFRRQVESHHRENDRLKLDATTPSTPAVRRVKTGAPQKSRASNNPKLLEKVEDRIKPMPLPEIEAIREDQRARRTRLDITPDLVTGWESTPDLVTGWES